MVTQQKFAKYKDDRWEIIRRGIESSFDPSTYSVGELADSFETVDLPFGRLAVITSDDSLYPETFRLLAMAGAEIAAVPLSPLEDWELQTGLLERSAENRINLLVAPDRRDHGPGFITALQTDFTVMTEWQDREFDGLLSQPEWYRCEDGETLLLQTVRPDTG